MKVVSYILLVFCVRMLVGYFMFFTFQLHVGENNNYDHHVSAVY